MNVFFSLLEGAAIASALSVDAFAAGFGYGASNTKIPVLSVQIINLVCSCVTGLALLAGTVLRQYIPPWLTLGICVCLLMLLGIVKLLDSITKSIIRKYNNLNKELQFSLFNFKFILNLYANPEQADVDASKTISAAEAASLAIALSLDGIAVGFGAALGNANGWAVFVSSLITNAAAVMLGCHLGAKIAHRLSFNLSWVSGAVLIALAAAKIATG